ncbi:MAG: 3-oxoacyl-ACP reductase FabG [Proteobacteria bacterium]|nr:3-oxoacyl-ACP reductase FabG [Pseudomonadota bacterium]
MTLTGKTALVTGSSRGIGREIAIRLAQEGAKVVVNYRTREKEAAEVVSLIAQEGGKAICIGADVSNYEAVEEMVRSIEKEMGPVDVLVNNATIHRGRKVHKLPLEDWDLVIKSCLYGAFHCCRCCIPSMIERKWGRIVNISSSVGEHGFPGDTAYGTAKAGLFGFTKSLARELAPFGVTANVVIPGFVLTEMTQALAHGNIEIMKAGIPLGRLGDGKEVAETVAFLASKGDYHTGSIYHADGGIGM